MDRQHEHQATRSGKAYKSDRSDDFAIQSRIAASAKDGSSLALAWPRLPAACLSGLRINEMLSDDHQDGPRVIDGACAQSFADNEAAPRWTCLAIVKNLWFTSRYGPPMQLAMKAEQ